GLCHQSAAPKGAFFYDTESNYFRGQCLFARDGGCIIFQQLWLKFSTNRYSQCDKNAIIRAVN
ncbi:hypothetical protein, partial [Photobacterium gaetbulicola]|uniref:hypothetical protein n=1 Tax=Photobacterium gaetbulicola TaxID=1295392 RepID=UPI001E62DF9C